jgi:hypothetical protein
MGADLRQGWSGLPAAPIPKLIVRVRFSSPAPITLSQVGGFAPLPGMTFVIIVEPAACHWSAIAWRWTCRRHAESAWPALTPAARAAVYGSTGRHASAT